jgi:hypothetical protein
MVSEARPRYENLQQPSLMYPSLHPPKWRQECAWKQGRNQHSEATTLALIFGGLLMETIVLVERLENRDNGVKRLGRFGDQ